MGLLRIGTSSWADPGFVEEWYPPGMPARERLPWYAQHFDAVEVNSTFYAVPAPRTVARWAEQTPEGFSFDVKAHRVLSRHSAGPDTLPKALREEADTTPKGRVVLDERLERALAEHLVAAVEPLRAAGKLSSFLVQLSPAFEPRDHRLDELAGLVDALAPTPVAIELRNRRWAERERLPDVLGWFEEHGAAWVGVDAPPAEHFTIMPRIDAVTRPDLAYVRLHGRNLKGYVRGRTVAERFAYRYSDEELRGIGERVQELAGQLTPEGHVRVMFNNNRGSDAPVAAARLRELLGDAAGSARPAASS